MSDVLALTVPALLAGVGLYGALTGTDVFSALTAGALDGLRTVVRIFPALVALLAAISALAALFGTYMIRPVVNGLLENGSKAYLAGAVGLTACIYIIGALSTLGYTQLMVRAAQKVLQEIRQDLFAHLQTQPLQYFDTTATAI